MHRLSVVMSMALLAATAWAVPAKPVLHSVTQDDGTVVKVRLVGDETFHYYVSEEGYPLLREGNNFFYARPSEADGRLEKVSAQRLGNAAAPQVSAAELDRMHSRLSSVWQQRREKKHIKLDPPAFARRANAGSTRTNYPAGPGLFPGNNFPAEGEQKVLVVLVEYTDTKFNLDNPYQYFHDMLNLEGFSEYGATGSAKQWFHDSSMGLFKPEFDVYGPITLSRNMSYYGGNDWWSGDDQHPEQMIIEACQQLDDTVDFTEYDRNNDGYIDNVFVFYAGRGEATGGGSDTVWPHSWNVTNVQTYRFDGVILDRYACSNEWEGSKPDGIGTFCHEFSHVMGLPDLYATSYTSAFTPGEWSALDYGPYNNDGRTPPLLSGFERYALGWIEPREITGACNVTLNPIVENECAIINTSTDGEYFIFENRQQEGWDEFLPGHGMLAWHIQYNASIWTYNTVNNDASHQYVDLEEADNSRSEYSRAGDAFPGTQNVTSFTDDTRPSMKSWNNSRQNLPITEITEQNGIITFLVDGGVDPVDPIVALDATDCEAASFTANWEASTDVNAKSYNLTVYQLNDDGRKVNLEGYAPLSVPVTQNSATVTGLYPLNTYYYYVTVVTNNNESDPSNIIEAVTGDPTFEFIAPVVVEPQEVAANSFIATWEPMDEADNYLLDVFTYIVGEPEVNAFGMEELSNNNTLPDGWTSSNNHGTYTTPTNVGQAAPSLRLNKDDSFVATGTFEANISGISFWLKGNNTTTGTQFIVAVKAPVQDVQSARQGAAAATEWVDVMAIDVDNNDGEVIFVDPELIPADAHAVRFTLTNHRSGSIALDDIAIETVDDPVATTLDGYNSLAVGNVTSYLVEGLQPQTTYSYRVTAKTVDGLTSLVSDEMSVTTPEETGLELLPVTGPAIRVNGLTVTIQGNAPVTVTDIAGRVLYHGAPATITLPSAGIYFIGNKKVALRP